MRTLILILTLAVAGNAAVVMTGTDLAAKNLRFVLPSDPSFNGKLHSMGIASNPSVTAIQNVGVVLTNGDQRGLCAFVLDWKITQANGTTTHQYMTRQSPTGFIWARQNPKEVGVPKVAGNDSIFISPMFEADRNTAAPPAMPSAQSGQITQFYSAAKAISVTLDLAVFNDGEVVGPDSREYADKFQAMIQARRDIQVEIHRAQIAKRTTAQIKAGLAKRGPELPFPAITDPPNVWYKWQVSRTTNELLRIGKATGSDDQMIQAAYRNYYKPHPALVRKAN